MNTERRNADRLARDRAEYLAVLKMERQSDTVFRWAVAGLIVAAVLMLVTFII
jgi:uncharacterized membrane protein YukC